MRFIVTGCSHRCMVLGLVGPQKSFCIGTVLSRPLFQRYVTALVILFVDCCLLF